MCKTHAALRTFFLTSQIFGLRGARKAGVLPFLSDVGPLAFPSLVAARLLLAVARLHHLPHVFRSCRVSSAAAARIQLQSYAFFWLPHVFISFSRTAGPTFPSKSLWRHRLPRHCCRPAVNVFLMHLTSPEKRKSSKRCQVPVSGPLWLRSYPSGAFSFGCVLMIVAPNEAGGDNYLTLKKKTTRRFCNLVAKRIFFVCRHQPKRASSRTSPQNLCLRRFLGVRDYWRSGSADKWEGREQSAPTATSSLKNFWIDHLNQLKRTSRLRTKKRDIHIRGDRAAEPLSAAIPGSSRLLEKWWCRQMGGLRTVCTDSHFSCKQNSVSTSRKDPTALPVAHLPKESAPRKRQ
ncbi:unnamed protein product [Caenorhabditis auriculariae]|uniref:Uncharacterized protein n=1 Tax=Caenorhabditis auriculariae TaxID=2777116 RepID=A0A8S1GUZ6_9PELO|nr:unnamed protein product [Caenorhabditis auriculariae]